MRHNTLRNVVYHLLASAGLQPDLEKPGLLPPTFDRDQTGLRRPADVWVPRWANGEAVVQYSTLQSPAASLRKT